jgi:hypothetical protein
MELAGLVGVLTADDFESDWSRRFRAACSFKKILWCHQTLNGTPTDVSLVFVREGNVYYSGGNLAI